MDFLEQDKLGDNPVEGIEIKRRATKFVVLKNVLFRCSFDGILLLCIANEETQEAMNEVYVGLCGTH